MKFQNRKQCSAYADTLNRLENDVDAVFFKYEKKLRDAGGDEAVLRALKEELHCMEQKCCRIIKDRLWRFMNEWDKL